MLIDSETSYMKLMLFPEDMKVLVSSIVCPDDSLDIWAQCCSFQKELGWILIRRNKSLDGITSNRRIEELGWYAGDGPYGTASLSLSRMWSHSLYC